MANLTRRGAIAAALATSAAGALPTLAVPAADPVPSALLLEWRAARDAYWTAEGVRAEVQSAFTERFFAEKFPNGIATIPHPGGHLAEVVTRRQYLDHLGDAWIEEHLCRDRAVVTAGVVSTEAEDRLDAAVEAMLERPICTAQDVAELAEMVQGENKRLPGDRWSDDGDADDLWECNHMGALFAAIRMLAAGGANG